MEIEPKNLARVYDEEGNKKVVWDGTKLYRVWAVPGGGEVWEPEKVKRLEYLMEKLKGL